MLKKYITTGITRVAISLDGESHQVYADSRCRHVNVGWEENITIRALAELIEKTLGFEREIMFDKNRLDGSAPKFMANQRLRGLTFEGLQVA